MSVFLALWLAVAGGPAPSAPSGLWQAQNPVTKQVPPESRIEIETREIASKLRCPVCQGLSLQDSPSGLAQEMRDVIRDQLTAGKTPDQVKAYFISKYGEWILLEPPPKGFNLAVYVLPILAVLGGAGFIVFATRRWTHKAPPGSAVEDDVGAEEVTSGR